MAVAAPVPEAGQHGCLQGGLAARLEAALTASVRGVLASTLAEGGACARAEAHVLDLCRAAERGKLCAGSSQVGHHSSAEVVAVLLHLAVQLIAFPPPRCTAEQGTQQGLPAAASRSTQTEAPATESRCVQAEAEAVRTRSRGVQATQPEPPPPPTQDCEAQAEARCGACGASAVLEQGAVCSGCAARPVCCQCEQRLVPQQGQVSNDLQDQDAECCRPGRRSRHVRRGVAGQVALRQQVHTDGPADLPEVRLAARAAGGRRVPEVQGRQGVLSQVPDRRGGGPGGPVPAVHSAGAPPQPQPRGRRGQHARRAHRGRLRHPELQLREQGACSSERTQHAARGACSACRAVRF
ncbi:unnamed protein product [Prorocentrum cordatum]|uniref:Uncharacterized protein n=1 Tax=Prorocentrum cordatum TaxID=2364126 RepID=A0ABN9TEW7_9DINO|nr:unnamed protein product [Polarella glacialis]